MKVNSLDCESGETDNSNKQNVSFSISVSTMNYFNFYCVKIVPKRAVRHRHPWSVVVKVLF